MHADFSVELGHDDPVLEIPWASDDHSVRYYDLKTSPELILQIPEAAAYVEIKAFLTRINAPGSPFETAKCDVWESREIAPEEEIFGADRKFVSYVDLVFVDESARSSFEKHEEFAKSLCLLLGRAPDIAATIELVIRRCYYHQRQTDRQEESDRMRSDRMSKDVQQGTPDCQAISLGQETSSSHDSKQYSSEQPNGRADRAEIVSRMEKAGELDSEASLKPANSYHSGAMPKSERPQATAPLKPQDLSMSLDQHDTSGMDYLPAANVFEGDTKVFLNESLAPLNKWSAGVTGFYLTAYMTGFGDGDCDSRPRWAIAVSLLQHALMQLSHI